MIKLKQINKWLGDYCHILGMVATGFGVVGTIISVVALAISVKSLDIAKTEFERSNKKADLNLNYNVYLSNGYSENKYFKNENGEIVFFQKDKTEDFYMPAEFFKSDGNWGEVISGRPGAELNIVIENQSDVPAKNPVMNFKFEGVDVPGENFKTRDGWKGIHDIHSTGLFTEIRWKPTDGTTIHKGMPIVIEGFNFSNSSVNRDNAYIEVTLSADNMNTKQFNIPVKMAKD